MSEIPKDLRYTETHEWVREEDDGTYTMGITDHAQSEMGEIVMVEMPPSGSSFSREDPMGSLEAVKTAEDYNAPMDLEVSGTNDSLEDSPELVNSDPYGRGWLVRFTASDASQLDDLMTAEEYGNHIGE
jgi:glycine cleavage system H protein